MVMYRLKFSSLDGLFRSRDAFGALAQYVAAACLFVSLFSWHPAALAISCPNFNYDLRSQDAINSFPGGCDVVGGDVIISGSEITSIDALRDIRFIEGNLIVRDNPMLLTLEGLGSLKSISGGLDIHGNQRLSNLDGLASLSGVDGYVYVYGNAALTDIKRLSGLTSVGTGPVGGTLNVSSNAALRSLDGLENITLIGSDLYINNNDLIRSLEGLANLGFVGRDVALSQSKRLVSLQGLEQLATIGRDLTIRENDTLPDLNGLTRLSTVGRNLTIKFNDNLSQIDALRNVRVVPGDLELNYNANLIHLNGLINLTRVGGKFWLVNNYRLGDIAGLRNLSSVGLDKSWDPSNYYSGLHIAYNADHLEDLEGLTGLTQIGGNLVIRSNWALRNLDGLVSLASISNDLYIINNSTLSDCNGLAPTLGWPNGPPEDSVEGFISIENNATGCDSVSDIILSFDSEVKITEAYIGLLGRAPDPAGLAYWSVQLESMVRAGQNADIALKKLTNDITLSPEWIGGTSSNGSYQSAAESVVARMYINLFSRQATNADLEYWSLRLTNRSTTESEMVVLLTRAANEAGNADSIVLGYKRQAASYYAARVPQERFNRSSARQAVENVIDAQSLLASKNFSDNL